MTVFNPERFVRELLAEGTSEGDIRTELKEKHGLSSDVSRRLIEQVKANNPEVMALRSQRTAARRQGEKKSSPITVLSGVGLLVLGVVILVAVWDSLGGGKPGFIPMMAGFSVVAGLGMILKGTWHLVRRR